MEDGGRRCCRSQVRSLHLSDERKLIAIFRYTGILLRQKETDESLRRLKKGNRQGGALSFFGRSAASSATPEEISSVEDSKVTLQMQLDVNAFGAEATEMGVDIEQSGPFAGLRNVVNGVAFVN